MSDKRLNRFLAQYGHHQIDDSYLTLYEDQGVAVLAFASIHERLDVEFDWMNHKARNGQGGHFNADNSRNLLDLIDEVDLLKLSLEKAGRSMTVAPEYRRVLDGSKKWLSQSNGSPIPEGFTPAVVEKYDPVFGMNDTAIAIDARSKVDLKLVGEGAYAIVHSFVDPNYGIKFARKKLKKGVEPRDVVRFKQEYEIMSQLDFPYILQVHRYDEAENSYTMEYCERTLEEYIRRRGAVKRADGDFGFRRRIALQFLYGLNYIHSKRICHRDLSLRNILLREYADGAVTVKLSDFGLAKRSDSEFTRTESEIRGTIVDPAVDRFKNFRPINDIWAVGFVLSYIFRGVKRLIDDSSPLAAIVHRCSHSDPAQRYGNVLEIVAAIEELDSDPRDAPA